MIFNLGRIKIKIRFSIFHTARMYFKKRNVCVFAYMAGTTAPCGWNRTVRGAVILIWLSLLDFSITIVILPPERIEF